MPTTERTVVLFVVTAVSLGLGFIAVKFGLPYIPPILFATLRIGVSAVVLLAYVSLTVDDWLPRTRRDALGIVAGGIVFIAAGNVFYFLGLQRTASGIFAIVLSFDPVLTIALGSLLLSDERLSRVGLVGVLVALVGVGIVVQPDPSHFLSGNLRGEEYALLCATSIAVGTVLQRWSNHDIGPSALTAWGMVLAVPTLFLVSVGVGESVTQIEPTLTALASLLFLSLVSTVIGYTLYFNLIEDVGAIRASLVQYALPVVASLAGWVVLGEQLPPEALVGYLVIFVGFLLLNAEGVEHLAGWVRPPH
jgi:drug/metabolite transporter (DMT)-like permease